MHVLWQWQKSFSSLDEVNQDNAMTVCYVTFEKETLLWKMTRILILVIQFLILSLFNASGFFSLQIK